VRRTALTERGAFVSGPSLMNSHMRGSCVTCLAKVRCEITPVNRTTSSEK
jgi:hypothetical protein